MSTPPVPVLGVRERAALTLHRAGEIRIPEFVLFFLLIGVGLLPLPQIGFSLENLAVAGIVGLGLLRRPPRTLGALEGLVPVVVVALFYLTVVSLFATPTEFAADWPTRLLRFLAVLLMVLVIGTGRVDIRSGLYGLTAALLVNIPLFYAGLVPANYGTYLTGLVGDKNVAGLAYALVAVLLLALPDRNRVRRLLVLVLGGAVWLTGSRTAMAAYVGAVLWVLLAPRLPVVGRWALGGAVAFGVNLLSEDYALIGRFSDREGSDLLRARIDAASEIKVGQAGFFGDGLGEAYVHLEDGNWFFHNSYWTALVEGGWPWMLVLVGATVLVLGRPFTSRLSTRQIALQAACVVILVCAWRLGEVFLTMYWGIAMGMAVLLADDTADPADGAPQERSTARVP